MRFWDEVTVVAQGGDGGNGHVGFRREAFTPKGGPDGGDGGNGGAVILVAEPGVTTLVEYSHSRLLAARNGRPGEGNRKTGADGESRIFPVPVGCQVYFQEQLIADLSVPGARWVAAKGGRGGKGNTFFKTSTHQAPDYAQDGQPGQRYEFTLILKTVADVGLIGLPNVGKSTLIAEISEARPKVADYPFTTIIPQLGVVRDGDKKRFVVADIPGLIPGASQGKGLGIRFLKHVERTRILVHLLDASLVNDDLPALNVDDSDEVILARVHEQFDMIDKELQLFSSDLATKARIVAFSKCDLPICARAYELAKDRLPFPTLPISSANHEGLPELLALVEKKLNSKDNDQASGGLHHASE